jgi:solute carrier family 6 amino acid/orphan transporter-like 15/16/17/18/20
MYAFQLTLPWSECPTVILEEAANATAIVPECAHSSETQFFWYRTALGITGDIGDFGGIRLEAKSKIRN